MKKLFRVYLKRDAMYLYLNGFEIVYIVPD